MAVAGCSQGNEVAPVRRTLAVCPSYIARGTDLQTVWLAPISGTEARLTRGDFVRIKIR